jgi:sec-independent protein translocase protein TatA
MGRAALPGLLEILIIVFLVLLLFGYKRIPSLAKSIGVGFAEFGKAFKKSANLPDSSSEVEAEPDKKEIDGRRGQS